MRRAGALVLLALLAWPAAADGDSRLTLQNGELSFANEDAGVANRLTVEYATRNGEATIRFADDTDPAGMATYPTPPCTPGAVNARGNPVELFCTRAAITSLVIDLGPNEDRLDSKLDQHPVSAAGNTGADTLTTGAGNDFLAGDQGDDTLSAGAGNDNLNGGEGADTLDAGDGDDTIVSADGIAERIACGPGDDKVSADAVDELTDCEHVARQGAGAPSAPAERDRTRPVLQAGATTTHRLRRKRRTIGVVATTSEKAIVQVTGYLDADGINDRLPPASVNVEVGGGGVQVALRLSKQQLRRIARDTRRGRRARARITVTAVDAAGNTSRARHFWIRLLRR